MPRSIFTSSFIIFPSAFQYSGQRLARLVRSLGSIMSKCEQETRSIAADDDERENKCGKLD